MRRIIVKIAIPAILAMGAAGSILAGSAVPAVAAAAPAASVAVAGNSTPNTHYYG